MTPENTIQLRDESIYPDKNVLKSALKDSFAAYEELLELFNNNEMSCEWRYYNDGKAWLCKVQKKKKTIVWISVWSGFIQAAIYFPVRLLEDMLSLDIDEKLKTKISETKNVGKSKPCIFEIRDRELLSDFEKVMIWKLSAR